MEIRTLAIILCLCIGSALSTAATTSTQKEQPILTSISESVNLQNLCRNRSPQSAMPRESKSNEVEYDVNSEETVEIGGEKEVRRKSWISRNCTTAILNIIIIPFVIAIAVAALGILFMLTQYKNIEVKWGNEEECPDYTKLIVVEAGNVLKEVLKNTTTIEMDPTI